MSFSFTVVKPTRGEARAAVVEELDKVVASQPVHAKDRGIIHDAVMAAINLLVDPSETREVAVNVGGSLGWINSTDGEPAIEHVSLSVSAFLREREP